MWTMWMSELAARSGLPVATVKFYLRAGLLHAGEATGVTRASYDDSHLRRLRLIRALTEVAGLRLDAVSAVLAAVDDDSVSFHAAMGSVHHRLTRPDGGTQPSPAAVAQVDALVERRGWQLHEPNPHTIALARALDALASLDHAASDELLDDYADAAQVVAERDVAAVARDDRVAGAEQAVIGTLLLEPVLVLLRRMAQEAVSAASLTEPARRGRPARARAGTASSAVRRRTR
jgi:DNA-binding transcriptional MerR regulator